ncbi:MAG TPA: TlpA disulfide reductase family protein [Streptosporangiaceae bacterium]|nr:TlpA disulfide reductase family protein [Streptosporangiaceae bacterium]
MTATDGTNVTATDETKRTIAPQTWTGALREVGRSAGRHKILSVLIALCVAGSLTAIGLIGSASGGTGKPAVTDGATFNLPSLGHSGQRVSLSGYRGQPLIVNFFASWCEPCQKETPLLASFYRAEKGKVALVGLDENDAVGNATAFTQKERVGYPVGFDPAGTAATAYGVNALPQTFFLNARHQVVDRVFGAMSPADLHRGIALATAKS